MPDNEPPKTKICRPTPGHHITQMPQDHLSIDLLGPYNATSQDDIYALTIYLHM